MSLGNTVWTLHLSHGIHRSLQGSAWPFDPAGALSARPPRSCPVPSPLPPPSPLLPHRTPGEGASLYDLTAFSEARPFPIFDVIHKLLVLVSSSIISYPRLIKKFRNRHFKFIT